MFSSRFVEYFALANELELDEVHNLLKHYEVGDE